MVPSCENAKSRWILTWEPNQQGNCLKTLLRGISLFEYGWRGCPNTALLLTLETQAEQYSDTVLRALQESLSSLVPWPAGTRGHKPGIGGLACQYLDCLRCRNFSALLLLCSPTVGAALPGNSMQPEHRARLRLWRLLLCPFRQTLAIWLHNSLVLWPC